MNTRHILYYCSSPHSYNEETTHFYASAVVENVENKWQHLLSSLKQKQVSAIIWVEQVVDMEKGVYMTRVVKHEIRKLPKVLEINKVKSNSADKKLKFTTGFPAVPVSMPGPAESVQEFFNWGQPATIQSVMQNAAIADPEGSF